MSILPLLPILSIYEKLNCLVSCVVKTQSLAQKVPGSNKKTFHFNANILSFQHSKQVYTLLGSGGGRCPSIERSSLKRFEHVWGLECHDLVQRGVCTGDLCLQWGDPQFTDRQTRTTENITLATSLAVCNDVMILFTKNYVVTEFNENILVKLKLFW